MNYRVVWPRRTIESLARAYLQGLVGEQASAITSAMAQFDLLLEKAPQSVGETRSGNDRILFVTPIVVEYEVFAEENIVVVTDARYC